MLVTVPHSTLSFGIAGGQGPDEHGLQQRSLTMGLSDHPEPLFHHRSRSSAYTQSPKRLSVFGERSRSNTATSTASSRQSPASSMTSMEASSLQSSQEDRTLSIVSSLGVDKQEKGPKSLLHRGSRILRRQGSKFSLSAALGEEDEVGKIMQKFDVTDFFHRSHRTSQKDTRMSPAFSLFLNF
jgi:hypothetical protein